jgi:PAS domain S-box-containing protein
MGKNNKAEIAEHDLWEVLSAIDKTVLELISSGAPFADVLQVLSRIIEEQSPGLLCSILLLDNNGRTLRHGAAPSLPDSYVRAIDGMAIGPSAGPCGTAAYRGEPVIVSDIASDPLWAEYRDLGLSHGLRACWSTPIFCGHGKVLGTFAMYYREPRSPGSRDLQVIERATHLAAIAIERERAEQALRQAENRYRSIVENAVEGFFQTTPAGGYISVNHALARMYGYDSPEELMTAVGDIGRQVYVDPNRRAEFKRAMELQGVVKDFEYQVYRKDGSKIWLSENARAVRDATGAMLYYEGTVEDISERKQAEIKLQERTAYLRALIENSPLAIVAHDSRGRVELCNPAFERLFLYRQSEIVGAELDELIATRELRPEANDLTRGVVAGETVHAITRRRRKDGTLVDVEIHGVPLTVDGEVRGGYGLYQDISERKQLEDQLRQAQRMEAVGQLAGGIAHDFNNLLTVIQGNSEVMLDRLGSADALRRNADQIKKAAERAASLTRQLLAFSRRQVLQPVVLDLNSVVADLGKMLPRLIGEDVELRIVPNTSPRWVKADQSQIEQVILNLVVNARDAMPKGGKLTIETANVELDESYARRHAGVRPGPYVVLAVSDTGVGMDARTQAHCFEPFFTTKEQGKGTGLGLATVYGVVKQSGGWIWVYSELGHGTTFKIYLPRVQQGAEEEKPVKGQCAAPRGTEAILVVEDQEGIRELARDFLESCGYRVLVAKDGGEALEIAEQHTGPIDLLVTDVVMPKVSGRELAQRLTALRPMVKTLYMSGYAEHAPAHHDTLDQETVSLEKPFSLHMLAGKVREALDAVQVSESRRNRDS